MTSRLAVIIFCTLLSPFAFGAGAAGADLELKCPCNLASNSSSSIVMDVGVTNIGSGSTGELIVRAYAHDTYNYRTSQDTAQFLGEVTLTSSLAANSEIDIATHKVRLRQPTSGTYYVSFLLLEDFVITDEVRMSDQVTFGTVASQTFQDLYFDEDPTIEIVGSTLTVNLPPIGNSGTENANVRVELAASEGTEFFGVPIFGMAEYTFDSAIAAGDQSDADTPQYTFDGTPGGFDFYHLAVIDNDSDFTLLLHTVEAPGVTYTGQSFAVLSQDFLQDSDNDGVDDENEKLMGTNPASASSTPGTSFIDVLAVYTPAVTSFYGGDPSARLDHLITVANQALTDSNVDIVFRLVSSVELDMDTSQNIVQWLDAAVDGEGVFADLQQRRTDAGADLIAMFRLYDQRGTCGLATLGGFATQGLMERSAHISANFIEFDECGDITLVHEMGHNMGLGHSFRQDETGTFNWSRGHGVDNRFATLMAYAVEFDLFTELPFFSNPNISLCDDSPCGVDISSDQGAFAAKSLNIVRYQVAAFTASADDDTDSDGVPDANDVFANDPAESVDTDNDNIGNNADYDDDNDGMPDGYENTVGHDPFVDDSGDDADSDGDTNLEEYDALPKATQFLQTTSSSASATRIHIINSSDQPQSFIGNLFSGDGSRLGSAEVDLSSSAVAANGRLVLTSGDLETLFGVDAWSGPAMLEVRGGDRFDLMSKLVSPSGLVSNTNCVRQDRVLNIEGFDSDNMTFVRFINTTNDPFGEITGTLYDANGNVIGSADVILMDSLAPKAQVWITRDNLASIMEEEWNGEAMLEVNSLDGLRLLNLNFVNSETFFNFSCFETQASGGIFLQTTSDSANSSLTHIVNTSDVAQQFTATLYNSDGDRLGAADQALHAGVIAAKGRVIISSGNLESTFTTDAWKGPAVVEVTGSDSFELMTKLESPSGLVSNTNCVRRDQVHNIEGADSPDLTFVRFINTGTDTISDLRGTLYDSAGDVIGEANQTLIASLAPKAQAWLNRNNIADIFGGWNGEAMLEVDAEPDLRLLNLNFINSETFFNFSCYEGSQ